VSDKKVASPWASADDKRRSRNDKREAVLRAAAQIFNEKGFQNTSLDEIAQRLNVTKPTLYYYVRNKDEILFECVRIGLTMIQESVQEVEAQGGSATDKLKAAMRRYAEIVTMDFGRCLILVGEDPLPVESQMKLRSIKADIDAEFRRLIQQGVSEGDLKPCDPKIAAFTIAGALSWIARWYQPSGSLKPEDIVDQSIALLMSGLCQSEK